MAADFNGKFTFFLIEIKNISLNLKTQNDPKNALCFSEMYIIKEKN